MAPLLALVVVSVLARLIGFAGVGYVDAWPEALAVGMAAMFLLAASAHFIEPRRSGLIATVPPGVPGPAGMVTVTGVLEAVGAAGLLVPPAAIDWARPVAAICLGVLMIVMFPANVRAARERRHTHAPTTPLIPRTLMQVLFVAAAAAVAVGSA